jgi:hypothetical protein
MSRPFQCTSRSSKKRAFRRSVARGSQPLPVLQSSYSWVRRAYRHPNFSSKPFKMSPALESCGGHITNGPEMLFSRNERQACESGIIQGWPARLIAQARRSKLALGVGKIQWSRSFLVNLASYATRTLSACAFHLWLHLPELHLRLCEWPIRFGPSVARFSR